MFEPVDVGEDQQVKKLAFDLRNIEMVMAAVLTPDKLRYIQYMLRRCVSQSTGWPWLGVPWSCMHTFGPSIL